MKREMKNNYLVKASLACVKKNEVSESVHVFKMCLVQYLDPAMLE